MKIGVIGHKRVPGREGGIEVVVEELSVRMAKLGHDVTLYNRYSKKVNNLSNYKGVKLITIPTIPSKKLDAVVYSFLASIHALFCGYDVIHYHALGPSFMLIIPKLFRKRIIVTVHGLNYKTPKWKGFGAKFIKFGELMTAKYADEIIVLSKNQEEYFFKKYNRETTYIPNGVDIKEILKPNIISNELDLKKDSYILFLSRIVPGKGLEYLIEAYKSLNLKIPLVIAGDADYVTDFQKKIQDMIDGDNRIVTTGFVNGDLLSELYSNTRLFVFPSEAEGMPMCVLEALSYNCHCLVSDIEENKEIGKSFVKYFKSCDVEDLKLRLIDALESNYDESRKYVIDNYNWRIVVNKTLKLYKGEKV